MAKQVKREWHTSNTKVGSGDYYGIGIKQPVAKPISSYMDLQPTPKRSNPSPKKLA